MQQNASLSASLPNYPSANTPAARGYAAAANAGQVAPAAPTTAEVSQASSMTPDQTKSSISEANLDALKQSAGLNNLASGLTKAAQTYADAFKNPWKMQNQAFGQTGTPNYQMTPLQQDRSV